jgi:hypothetical protein
MSIVSCKVNGNEMNMPQALDKTESLALMPVLRIRRLYA